MSREQALTVEQKERLRTLLCEMQDAVAAHVIAERDVAMFEDLSQVVAVTESDTVYRIDRISEDAIVEWFEAHWPEDLPVRLVMEGISDSKLLVFPKSTDPSSVGLTCIVDPIDGTRGLMYDKRSAWVLAGVAPNRGGAATLADIEVAAMTELPVVKQRLADQLSAIRGLGVDGVRAARVDLATGTRTSLKPSPSRAEDLHNGYVGFSRFFPAGKELLARFEEKLHTRLYGAERLAELAIFEDQYICTGGQIYELCTGRDRMIADLRPLVHAKLKLDAAMNCHPYDICTVLVLEELGGVVGRPDGSALDAPLDTTSPVAWVGYANAALAMHVEPVMQELLKEQLK